MPRRSQNAQWLAISQLTREVDGKRPERQTNVGAGDSHTNRSPTQADPSSCGTCGTLTLGALRVLAVLRKAVAPKSLKTGRIVGELPHGLHNRVRRFIRLAHFGLLRLTGGIGEPSHKSTPVTDNRPSLSVEERE